MSQDNNVSDHGQIIKSSTNHEAGSQVAGNIENIAIEHSHKSHDPLAQFQVKKLLDIKIAGIDISITNSSLAMIFSTIAIIVILLIATRKRTLIPSKLQIIAESLYQMVLDMVKSNIGDYGIKFFPFIFTLFTFILACNFTGMLPYSFTPTSQIATTFTLSIASFSLVVLFGIIHNGPLGFIKIFLPSGIPFWIAPMVFLVELFSFLIRPFTLALRLLANMVAGHVLMKIIAGFIIVLGVSLGFLPFIFSILVTGFEFFVAFLQAYIFSILVCIYLGEMASEH